jgi:hypothetical protein
MKKLNLILAGGVLLSMLMMSFKDDDAPCKEKLKEELEIAVLNAKAEGRSDSQIEAIQELMLRKCKKESELWNYYHTKVINYSLTTEEQRKADKEVRKLIDKYFTTYKNAILLHILAVTDNYTNKWAFEANNILGVNYMFEDSPNGELMSSYDYSPEDGLYSYPSLDDCFKAIVPWVNDYLPDEGDGEMEFYYDGLKMKFGEEYYDYYILPYFDKLK